MNEPKRRGRPPKAKLLQPVETNARVEGGDCAECGQDVGHYDDCGTGITGVESFGHDSAAEVIAKSLAQAYAQRVWNGQNKDIPRNERLERVRKALEGQGLSMEGVTL